jgi:hypothetical protein
MPSTINSSETCPIQAAASNPSLCVQCPELCSIIDWHRLINRTSNVPDMRPPVKLGWGLKLLWRNPRTKRKKSPLSHYGLVYSKQAGHRYGCDIAAHCQGLWFNDQSGFGKQFKMSHFYPDDSRDKTDIWSNDEE